MDSDKLMKTYLQMQSFVAVVMVALFAAIAQADGRKPNFIIVLVDDLGYADIEPFGSKANRTPNLNRLAAEGMCFTGFYYFMSQLQAVRSGKWKLHLALDPKLVTWTGRPTGTAKAQLYDLSADPGELTNVIAEHPDVVRRLNELADSARKDIGDYQVKGAGARPTIRVAESKPLSVPESVLLPFPEQPSGRPNRVSAVFPGKRPQRQE